MVLLVLLAVEGITLIDVRGLITWHIVVGSLLVPPALLKTATTGWRMVRYYAGNRDYRTAGPPPLILRLLAPLVVASTLALLTTGIVVGVVGPDSARASIWGTPASLLFLHQASFAVWVGPPRSMSSDGSSRQPASSEVERHRLSRDARFAVR